MRHPFSYHLGAVDSRLGDTYMLPLTHIFQATLSLQIVMVVWLISE